MNINQFNGFAKKNFKFCKDNAVFLKKMTVQWNLDLRKPDLKKIF